MKAKVYVAASSHELPRARAVMRALEAAGFIITWDWTDSVEAKIAAGVAEAKMDDAECEACARRDLQGVAEADALVFLAPNGTSKMGWLEVGFALALGIPCITAHPSGEVARQSIATRLGVITTDLGIINAVRDVTRERSPMLGKMQFVRWIAGQVIAHQVKLERAHDVRRIDSLRAQIAGDLQLIAMRSIDATHSFFSRAA